jgi:hypothetical protein
MSNSRRFAWDEGIGDPNWHRWLQVTPEVRASSSIQLQTVDITSKGDISSSATAPIRDLFSRATAESEAASSRALARILALVPLRPPAPPPETTATISHTPITPTTVHALPPPPPPPRDRATLIVDAEADAIRERVRIRTSGGLPAPPPALAPRTTNATLLSAEERADNLLIIQPLRRLLRGDEAANAAAAAILAPPPQLPPPQLPPPPQSSDSTHASIVDTTHASLERRTPAAVISSVARNFHGYLSGRELLQQAQLLARYSNEAPETIAQVNRSFNKNNGTKSNNGSIKHEDSVNTSIVADIAVVEPDVRTRQNTTTRIPPPQLGSTTTSSSRGSGTSSHQQSLQQQQSSSHIPRPRSKADWALEPGTWSFAVPLNRVQRNVVKPPTRPSCFDLGDGDDDVSIFMAPVLPNLIVKSMGSKVPSPPSLPPPPPPPAAQIQTKNERVVAVVKKRVNVVVKSKGSGGSGVGVGVGGGVGGTSQTKRTAAFVSVPIALAPRSSPIHDVLESALKGHSDFVPMEFMTTQEPSVVAMAVAPITIRQPAASPPSKPLRPVASPPPSKPLRPAASPPPSTLLRPAASPPSRSSVSSSASRSRLYGRPIESSMLFSEGDNVGGISASPTFLRHLKGIEDESASVYLSPSSIRLQEGRRLFSGGDESP